MSLVESDGLLIAADETNISEAAVSGHSGMSQSPSSTAAETTIPVSEQLRDKLRVAKAKQGIDYDSYLREKLNFED